MGTQLGVAAGVYLAITALCFWRPPAGRRAVGVLFALMAAAVNGAITALAPKLFIELAGQAPWAWYALSVSPWPNRPRGRSAPP